MGGNRGDRETSVLGPWGPHSFARILIICHESPTRAIVETLKSLFGSTVQNFEIMCVGVPPDGLKKLRSWTREDSRVSFVDKLPGDIPQDGAILVLPAGWVLTPYSLLAMWRAVAMPTVEVLRSVTEGASGTLEFWNAKWLANQGSLDSAESNARRLGVERWVSAEGLGIHSFDLPAPRVFFRRGAADQHAIDVVLYDSANKKFVERKDQEITSLKAEIRELTRVLSSRGVGQAGFRDRIAASVRRRIRRFR